ncbi:hypothetical protein JZK55_00590 [Dissulfurispira thermophila]|uniref:DUF3373 domain-containing protein n=1 Tax=Dissulfurispira thermophila TaxID=2715679 RepID=A0A7G1H0B6_9BACT|nr:DUF3373 domain-containing protein [Dissulfurispira thermophila]BCB95137.1 hypothetical protein JZK55_00590 [Dissulfurispira thermophila]
MKKFLVVLLSLSLMLPLPVFAADQADLLQKIEALSKELDRLKQQMQEMQQKEAAKEERITVVEKKAEEAAGPSWLEIGGDFRARIDSLSGKTHDARLLGGTPFGSTITGVDGKDVKNDSLFTNRLGLNLRAKATEDITVKARLLMYKVWGMGNTNPVTTNAFFADRTVFDGTTGHIPQDNTLRVDQAYATWSNIGGAPVWFSIGRRPSTGGIPQNLRTNTEKTGTAGVPSLLVDYAFDGLTIGYAPDIEALPGAYAKFCYGKGLDSGFRPKNNNLKDTSMFGIDVVPYDTDKFHVEFNWNRGANIFFNPDAIDNNTNLGEIDWYGATVMGKVGDLNLFASGAISKTHPNNNSMGPFADGNSFGLMWDTVEGKKSRTGNAIYLGGRYDITSTGTKIGLEYNHGSKNWITFVPANDDIWTGKLGTRGDVYEVYLIQELNKKPIAKRGKAFFRLGYQYYDFKYTGSNNWVGAPQKISDLNKTTGAGVFKEVIDKAHDIYLTFDVLF